MKVTRLKIFSSLRSRLMLVGILALLPALGLVLYNGAQLREQAAANAKDDALRLAHFTASNQDALIEGARQMLIVLSYHAVVRDLQSDACDAFLAELLTRSTAYTAISVAAPNGDVLCSALPQTQVVNIADRAYFRRVLQTRDFVVSEYLIGRVSGKAAITTAYPVLDDAHLKGVVIAGLDLEWMNKLAESVALPAGSVINFIDRNGTILTRFPEPEKYVGTPFADAPIIKTILESNREGTTQAWGLDGVDRLYAFLPLKTGAETLGFITIGIPSALVLAEAARVTNTLLIGLISVTALALTATWIGGDLFFLRQIQTIRTIAQRVGKGDLRARTGVASDHTELGELAREFDAMTESLQHEEAERERAEAALARSEKEFRGLAENALVGIFRTTLSGQILFLNEAITRLLEFDSPEEMMTQSAIVRYKNPADRAALLDVLGAQGAVTNLEIEILTKTNQIRTVLLSAWLDAQVLSGMLIDITDRRRAEKKIHEQVEYLDAMRQIDTAILASVDLRLTLDIFLAQVVKQLGADAADVLLVEPHTQALEYKGGRGFRSDAVTRTRLRMGEGQAGRAALERQTLSHPDFSKTQPFFAQSNLLQGEDFAAYHAVPLVAKGDVKGVLEVWQRAPLDVDEEWIAFLEALAGQGAIAIDNAALFDGLQRSSADLQVAYDATIEGWSRALDLRDKETEGHTQRVTEMTVQLARALGMRADEIVHVRRGALLHDIGKMGVPDAILHKPGKLTEEEWAQMRRHPQFAYEMLSPIAYLKPALDIPYAHHEKWDGSGYPRGLRGEEIPLSARLFAVIDVWDALTSDRPYRAAWSAEKTRDYIAQSAGTHFDPRVVEVFLREP